MNIKVIASLILFVMAMPFAALASDESDSYDGQITWDGANADTSDEGSNLQPAPLVVTPNN